MTDAGKTKRKAKPQPRNYWFVDFAALMALVFVIGVILMIVVINLMTTSGIIQTQFYIATMSPTASTPTPSP